MELKKSLEKYEILPFTEISLRTFTKEILNQDHQKTLDIIDEMDISIEKDGKSIISFDHIIELIKQKLLEEWNEKEWF